VGRVLHPVVEFNVPVQESASAPGVRNWVLKTFGEDLQLLRPHLHPVSLSPGQVLTEVGDEIRHVYFLESGAVSKLTVFQDGAEIESALVGKQGAVGAMAGLGLRHALTRDVCYLPGEAWRIPAERLVEICHLSNTVHEVLDRACAWKMLCLVRNGACNACHSLDRRLCRWLLTCSDALESDDIRMPQEVLGRMLGVRRSSINPVLQKLRNDGLITLERGHIRILDRAAFGARACECYEATLTDAHKWLSFEHEAPRRPGARPRW
jgi:CRP-like cAMP-binding protein